MSAFDAGGTDTAGATDMSGGKGIALTSGRLLGELGKAAVSWSEFGGLRFSSGAGRTSEATALMPALEGAAAFGLAGGLGFCWVGGLGCSLAGL